MNGMEHIRPARAEDLNRIAEIEIFNYRLNFYPIFRSDAYYFGEKTVANGAALPPGPKIVTDLYDAVRDFLGETGDDARRSG